MTRYSDLFKSAIVAFVAFISLHGPLSAQTYVTDAFGVFDSAAEPSRNTWSGVQGVDDGKGNLRYRTVAPGSVDQLLAVNGSKSMVAGKQSAEFLVIALDSSGNTVADGTQIDFWIETAPDASFGTTWGIASYLYTPDPKSGLFRAGASSGNRQSERTEYRVNPDTDSATIAPVAMDVLQVEGIARAESMAINDAYGNQIQDGTSMVLVVSTRGDTYDLIPASVMQGKGIARFQSVTPDAASMHWEMAAVRSDEVPLQPEPLELLGVPEHQAKAVNGVAATELVLGPFLSSAGYYLNDGTEMDLVIRRGNQIQSRHRGWTVDGRVKFVLPLTRQDLPATFEVSGRFASFEVTLERDEVIMADEVTK